ncbi:PC-esterase domain-containing protein 1A [Bulinus truncatus]|nr:PC-esterase domain-containing protein 1A [Bulinus truncatus]
MVFLSTEVSTILHNRFIVIIGDSIQRGIYKDIVLLLHENRFLTERELRNKGEFNFMNDKLIEGGRKGEMCNGINYREVRQFQTDNHLVRFYFITRCYNTYMESILNDLKKEPLPDILIINSCLWDITRYGQNAINEYKDNLDKVFGRFSQCLPKNCLVLWNTTLPISSSARGGFLVPEIEFMTSTLRLDIIEANFFAKQVAIKHGYDVLDLHFYLRHHLQRRVRDGIHWDMLAHRHITNLILNHVCAAWNLSMQLKPVIFGDQRSLLEPNNSKQCSPKKSFNNFNVDFQRYNNRQDPVFSFDVRNFYSWKPYGQVTHQVRVNRECSYRHQPYRQRNYY